MDNKNPTEGDAKKLMSVVIVMSILVVVLFGLGPLV